MAGNIKQFMPLLEGLVYNGQNEMCKPPNIIDIKFCAVIGEKDGILYEDIANPEHKIWSLFIVRYGNNGHTYLAYFLYDNTKYLAWDCYGYNYYVILHGGTNATNINNISTSKSKLAFSIPQKVLFDELIKHCVAK